MSTEIEPKYHEIMQQLARGLDQILNGKVTPENKRRTGFMLWVYDFADGPKAGKMNYISNAAQLDMHLAVKELLAHLEGRLMKETPTKQ